MSGDTDRQGRRVTAQWLEDQRGRPQYRAVPHISRSLGRVMRPLSKDNGGGHTGLAPYWEQIVGKRFARLSKPVRLTGRAPERVLTIRAPGPAAALIMASSDMIIERANGFLGMAQISRLKIIQSPMKSDPRKTAQISQGLTPKMQERLQSGLEGVSDPDVRSALEMLGRKVLSHQKP